MRRRRRRGPSASPRASRSASVRRRRRASSSSIASDRVRRVVRRRRCGCCGPTRLGLAAASASARPTHVPVGPGSAWSPLDLVESVSSAQDAAARRRQQLVDLGGCRDRRVEASSSRPPSAQTGLEQLVEHARARARRPGLLEPPRRHDRRRSVCAESRDASDVARRLGVVEPHQADLAAQRKPVAAATWPRTRSITARTSAAEPPSAAWMKLACLSDTHAVADAQPAQAEPVDQLRRR